MIPVRMVSLECHGRPRLRNKIFHANWQDIDYIVLSNGMKQAMIGNNTGGQEN